jgi:hypothetical protein
LNRVIMVLAALQAAMFGGIFAETIIRRPFRDMFAWLDAYLTVRANGGLPGYLLSFHNEHRLVWIRLLTMLDVSLFHTSGVPFIVASTTCLLVAAVLVTRELARGVGQPPTALIWLCPMLFLTAANAVDCSIPINGVYPLTLVFLVGTCVLFDSEADAGRYVVARRIAATLCAAAAGVANAVGLAVWPLLVWLAWRGRAGPRWVATIVCIGAVYILAYVHGMAPIADEIRDPATESVTPLRHLAKMFGYFLAYLGLPISRMASFALLGRLLGAILLVLGGGAVVYFGLLARSVSRLRRIATALIGFTFGGALLAASGRADLTPEIALPVRYTILVTPLHAGLLAVLLSMLPRGTGTARRRAIVLAGGVLVSLMLIARQAIGGISAIRIAGSMRAAIDRYYTGAHGAEAASAVYPDLQAADGILTRLRALGLFSD